MWIISRTSLRWFGNQARLAAVSRLTFAGERTRFSMVPKVIVAAAVSVACMAAPSPARAAGELWTGFQENTSGFERWDNATTSSLGVGPNPGDGVTFVAPRDVTFGPDGNAYISVYDHTGPSSSGPGILKFNGSTGAFMGLFATTHPTVGQGFPWQMAWGQDGYLYTTDFYSKALHRFDQSGAPAGLSPGSSVIAAGVVGGSPGGLAWGEGHIWITNANPGAGGLRKIDPSTGVDSGFDIQTINGASGFYGVDYNEADGKIYFLDFNGAAQSPIYRIDTDGTDLEIAVDALAVGGNLNSGTDIKFNPANGMLGVVIAGVRVREFDVTNGTFFREFPAITNPTFSGMEGIDYQRIADVIEPFILGDLDDDGDVDNFDILAFELALTNPSGYAAAYPGVDREERGDINEDDAFDNGDIAPFETLLTGAPLMAGLDGSPSIFGAAMLSMKAQALGVEVPEPASLVALALGAVILTLRSRQSPAA
jgi:hypothetical protein